MSISDPTRTPGTSPPTTTKSASSLSAEDAEETRKLDAIFERIRKNVPETPYILTVPCSEPRYHHWSRHEAESWCQHTPFEPSEERLQYMSFLWREHADSCFVVRTEVDEERDRREAMKAKGMSSGTSTPVRSDLPKKKISLAAYKSKQANGLRGVSAKETPPASQEQPKKEETSVRKEHPLPAKPVDTPTTAHKRHLPEDSERPSPKKPRDNAQHAPKRPRTSDSSTDKPTINTSTAQSTPHGLPPMISPISSPNPLGLPPLLSPTLPDVIEAELEKRASQHTRTPSNTSSSSEGKSNAAMSSPRDFVKSRVDSPTRVSSTAEKKERPVKKEDPEKDHMSRAKDIPMKKSETVQIETKPKVADEKPPSLMVTLKYGRRKRQEVERYLRLPPKRKPREEQKAALEDAKEPEAARKPDLHAKTKEGITKDANRKPAPSIAVGDKEDKTKNAPEKRARQADDSRSDAPPPKRQKPPAAIETEKKPRTPEKPPSSPVASSRSSVPKPQYLTPRKDLKNVGMMRSNSTDSNCAPATATPGQSGSTPASSQTEMSKGPTSAPLNGKSTDVQIWSSCSRKLNDLGRRLKHEAQALSKSGASPKDRKRAAVLSIECLLAYMGAYSSLDYMCHLQHQPGNIEKNWRTLLPLHRFFRSACQEFPHLEALRLHLGAVISARIAAIVTERLHHPPSSTSTNTTNSTSAPSPADPSTSTNPHPSDAQYLLRTLSDAFKDIAAFTAEARSKLPLEDLITQYPHTWSGRATPAPESTARWEKLAPGCLEGPYLLPWGPDMTPVQGLRVGLCLLEEWMGREGVRVEGGLVVRLS